jgi:hypothetical protein
LLRLSRVEAREVVDECIGKPDDAGGERSLMNLRLTRSLLSSAAG